MVEEIKTGVMVGDLMTRNFVHVSPNTDLRECTKIMIKKKVGSLIIEIGSELKGILTEKDIIWAIYKKNKLDLKKVLAKDLMKKKVVTIKPSADISDALRKMKKKKVRRLPVIENGKIIGMLTLKDILRIDPGLFGMITETFQIKEETKKLKAERVVAEKKPGVCEECGAYGVLYGDSGAWFCHSCYSKR